MPRAKGKKKGSVGKKKKGRKAQAPPLTDARQLNVPYYSGLQLTGKVRGGKGRKTTGTRGLSGGMPYASIRTGVPPQGSQDLTQRQALIDAQTSSAQAKTAMDSFLVQAKLQQKENDFELKKQKQLYEQSMRTRQYDDKMRIDYEKKLEKERAAEQKKLEKERAAEQKKREKELNRPDSAMYANAETNTAPEMRPPAAEIATQTDIPIPAPRGPTPMDVERPHGYRPPALIGRRVLEYGIGEKRELVEEDKNDQASKKEKPNPPTPATRPTNTPMEVDTLRKILMGQRTIEKGVGTKRELIIEIGTNNQLPLEYGSHNRLLLENGSVKATDTKKLRPSPPPPPPRPPAPMQVDPIERPLNALPQETSTTSRVKPQTLNPVATSLDSTPAVPVQVQPISNPIDNRPDYSSYVTTISNFEYNNIDDTKHEHVQPSNVEQPFEFNDNASNQERIVDMRIANIDREILKGQSTLAPIQPPQQAIVKTKGQSTLAPIQTPQQAIVKAKGQSTLAPIQTPQRAIVKAKGSTSAQPESSPSQHMDLALVPMSGQTTRLLSNGKRAGSPLFNNPAERVYLPHIRGIIRKTLRPKNPIPRKQRRWNYYD